MNTYPPEPFMHRDAYGKDTLQKSERWQTRAQQEITGFRGGEGHVRRPHTVIVNDPSKPPNQNNTDRRGLRAHFQTPRTLKPPH